MSASESTPVAWASRDVGALAGTGRVTLLTAQVGRFTLEVHDATGSNGCIHIVMWSVTDGGKRLAEGVTDSSDAAKVAAEMEACRLAITKFDPANDLGAMCDAFAAITPAESGRTATAHPDAELLAAWDDYVAAHRAREQAVDANPDGTDEDYEPYWTVVDRHAGQIERFQASTVEGFAVQLRFLFAARMESQSSFRAAVYEEPVDDELVAELDGDWRDGMLWRMVQAAVQAGGKVAS